MDTIKTTIAMIEMKKTKAKLTFKKSERIII